MIRLLVLILALSVDVSMAGQGNRNVGVALGTGNSVKAILFLNDAWSVGAGYYQYQYDRSRDTAPGYKHSINLVYFGLRRYWEMATNTEFFLEGSFSSRISNYIGNTISENSRQSTFGFYPGLELRLSEKVSVAGRAGIDYVATQYKTYSDSAIYGPVGAVELIYYF